jgi:hypothetical protein
MRFVSLRILLALSAMAPALHAQDAARPTVDLAAKKTQRPSPVASAEPPSPDFPELSQLDEAFKQTSMGKSADQFRLHAEWRRLRNQVANIPDVVAAKKAADAARTDLEKRQLLRHYYDVCYAHMQALAQAPDVKTGLEEMRTGHLGALDQPRVRPSPSPAPSVKSDGASPTPTPTPSGNAEDEDSRPD